MKWLVTGGAGFIGTNLCIRLIEEGHSVTILDNLSRAGSETNADFLRSRYGVEIYRLDVSDAESWTHGPDLVGRPDAIAHLAGQVSFLESLKNPLRDFEVNARATLLLLEYVRLHAPEAAFIGMSSNKIYGSLSYVRVEETDTRYIAPDFPRGFSEDLPLNFDGPYGCSKGTADQYIGDFARMYGLRTASLRQSSVYGPHQHPRSDQGWVAHLVEETVSQRPIALNGRGKQVRDLLHADDLSRLILRLSTCLEPGVGHHLNVGGGPENSLSILELFLWLKDRGLNPKFSTGNERPKDQKIFVSDNERVTKLTGWTPQISTDQGLQAMLDRIHRPGG